jgi:putative membrane protein insertion efficiency factor
MSAFATRCRRFAALAARRALLVPLLAYRYGLSPFMPPACRFAPSCSEYAQDALLRHGAIGGSWLTLRRLCRCHPWGGSGYDPVPENFGLSRGPATQAERSHR